MFRSKLVFFISLVLFVGAGWFFFLHAGPVVVNAPPPAGPIVAFGDSLTAGFGAPQGESYPDQLARLIGQPVRNAGVTGDAVIDANDRLKKDVLDARPGIVIVLLGGNDLLQRRDLDKSFTLLERMIHEIQGRGAMIVLAGIKDWAPIGGISTRYQQLAERAGCLYIPNILRGIITRPELMSDQIHPNAKGYAIMAARIAEALEPYIKR